MFRQPPRTREGRVVSLPEGAVGAIAAVGLARSAIQLRDPQRKETAAWLPRLVVLGTLPGGGSKNPTFLSQPGAWRAGMTQAPPQRPPPQCKPA